LQLFSRQHWSHLCDKVTEHTIVSQVDVESMQVTVFS
jgi:hypothetical protein